MEKSFNRNFGHCCSPCRANSTTEIRNVQLICNIKNVTITDPL